MVLVGVSPGSSTGSSASRDLPHARRPFIGRRAAASRNIIFIVADALRADRLSCYGHNGHLTPHLDALARDGVLYRNMSAQASWTKPSVATMLTSLYPSTHRAIIERDLLPDDVLTLPEVLHEQGYRTIGFTTNMFTSAQFNFQQGYDEYTFLESTYPFLATRGYSQQGVFTAPYLMRSVIEELTQSPAPRRYHDAASLNHQALSWLETNRDTRFFLYLHYMDPHQPYYEHPYDGQSPGVVAQNKAPTQAHYLRRLYDGEVAYLDSYLGALFAALKRWGLYDDALIVFTADHGEEFQEHGDWGHGRTLYEEQLHVPLIIKYPGGAHAGAVDVGFARGLDIAPTVLDVAKVPIPAVMQGVSLRPGAAASRAETIFAEVNRQSNVIRAIRTRHRKLIVANADNPRGLPAVALFDLQTDTEEQQNLAQSEPDTVGLLRAELDRVIAFAKAYAVDGQSKELDADTRERLRQLGY
jgi:arylsulfatase A-like enzyme